MTDERKTPWPPPTGIGYDLIFSPGGGLLMIPLSIQFGGTLVDEDFLARFIDATTLPITDPAEWARRDLAKQLRTATWFVDSSRFTADSANRMTRRLHGHDD